MPFLLGHASFRASKNHPFFFEHSAGPFVRCRSYCSFNAALSVHLQYTTILQYTVFGTFTAMHVPVHPLSIFYLDVPAADYGTHVERRSLKEP